MIEWTKLEPVPLKEKIEPESISSQIDRTISQIKRSYYIPPGVELKNGKNGVLIGIDSENKVHMAALDKVMLDYPTDWDHNELEETASFKEESLNYESVTNLNTRFYKTVELIDFLKVFAVQQKLLKMEQIKDIDKEKINEKFFDVFSPEKVTLPEIKVSPEVKETNIVPFVLAPKVPKKEKEPTTIIPFVPKQKDPELKEVQKEPEITKIIPFVPKPKDKEKKKEKGPATIIPFVPKPKKEFDMATEEEFDRAANLKVSSNELNFIFNNFEDLYEWMLDTSSLTSRLKAAFYVSKTNSLLIPVTDFVNSFQNQKLSNNLLSFANKNQIYSYINPVYLLWNK